LSTASRLFYEQGFGAVGVDTIVARAGVAKMTLYRHFPTKDELIISYLKRADERFLRWVEEAVASETDPCEQLLSIFRALARQATSPTCCGCPFQGTAAEFPDPNHGAHRVALANKQRLHARFAGLAWLGGLRAPDVVADQLLMLMDGAWVAVRMFGPNNPAVNVASAAAAIVAAHEPKRRMAADSV
jgi:AcrR family transcriptional regulator